MVVNVFRPARSIKIVYSMKKVRVSHLTFSSICKNIYKRVRRRFGNTGNERSYLSTQCGLLYASSIAPTGQLFFASAAVDSDSGGTSVSMALATPSSVMEKTSGQIPAQSPHQMQFSLTLYFIITSFYYSKVRRSAILNFFVAFTECRPPFAK